MASRSAKTWNAPNGAFRISHAPPSSSGTYISDHLFRCPTSANAMSSGTPRSSNPPLSPARAPPQTELGFDQSAGFDTTDPEALPEFDFDQSARLRHARPTRRTGCGARVHSASRCPSTHPLVRSLHGRTVSLHLGRGITSQGKVAGVPRLAQGACRTCATAFEMPIPLRAALFVELDR